ncbi:hypothetical protein SAMN02800692_0213 [Luteibacter sp. UNC138MFCol5.1]|uniref:universal stress protein n=1 Tax=Luteibacter sp. UNC138MFCol5.1 TaxID=1502774 RepID=UPI0008D4F4E2|nr:universal stress protein [Luteibacter sp. UNC138MFCol5.1]SEO32016.1 hypothetical protein SAMN02800692_0213 [Luteibacter sp. UNC138MFCol5.1]
MTKQTSAPSPSLTGMDTCLQPVGDVLAIVGAPRDAASFVASRLAARNKGSVTGLVVSPAFLGAHEPSHDATIFSLLDRPPEAVHARDLEPGGDGDCFLQLARTVGTSSARWTTAEVDVARRLASLAAWHDLIVVQRPGDPHLKPLDGLSHLVRLGVPCLILPTVCAPSGVFDRVVVAWDGSQPATRSVRAALPFLSAAREVLLLVGGMEKAPDDLPVFDPMAFLTGHGIETTRGRLSAAPAVAGTALLDRCRRFKADLLVMGAYGHAPLRERLFGGATRHVLEHGSIATFLCH